MSTARPVAQILTTSFPSAPGDPRGSFVAALCEALAPRWERIEVLSPAPLEPAAGAYARSRGAHQGPRPLSLRAPLTRHQSPDPFGLFAGEGAPERLSHAPLRGALAGFIVTRGLRRLARQRWSAVAREGADVELCCHWLLPGPFVTPAPALYYCHGSDLALLEGLPGAPLIARHLARSARGIIFVSEALRARFEALLKEPASCPLWVCPMGSAPPAPEGLLRAQLCAGKSGMLLLATVGRLVPIKGYRFLAKALACATLRERIWWVAAGDGPERAPLQRWCRGAGIRLTLLGTLSPSERDALLDAADLFALPSVPQGRRAEGAPLALMEALQAGCPTICSALPGPLEVSAEGGAWTPPAGSLRAWRLALRAALDPWSRRRRSALARARGARFSWAHLAPRHDQLLSECFRRGRS